MLFVVGALSMVAGIFLVPTGEAASALHPLQAAATTLCFVSALLAFTIGWFDE